MRRILAALVLLLVAAAPVAARTLLINANGYTLTGSGQLLQFEAMLIDRHGRVEQLYRKGERLPAFPKDVARIDAKRRTVLPGLIDAHGHVMLLGQQLTTVDLSDTRSLAEAQARVRAYAAANPQARWIIGRGWNQVTWRMDRFPTAAELDAAVADRPVWLERIDGHAGWANSAALQLAGVSAATADPPGGRIERDAGGAPAGVLVDAAAALVQRHVPPPTEAEQAAMLEAALRELASVGLTAVHDAGIDLPTWQLYNRFGREGRLTTRIYAMAGGLEAMQAIAPDGPTPWLYDGRLTLRAVKLYTDGALGSRGAALKADYSDAAGNQGLLFMTDTVLKNSIVRAAFDKFQVNVHAIGDRANAQVIDAFAEIVPAMGNSLRHRIEHAQVIDPADLPRIAQLGLIASVQPTHATSDKAMAEDRIGAQRIVGAYAWERLRASGARLALGSDFPVEPANPFFGLHAAVTRQDRSGAPPGGWYPAEALSRASALAGFTIDAAYAGGMEAMVGTLERGKHADFIIVDRDLFETSAGDIWRTRVVGTWLSGRQVFGQGERAR